MTDDPRWDVDRPDLSWSIDLMHNPKPYPPLVHDFRHWIAEGTSRAFVQVGIPTRIRYQGVNGFAYGSRERIEILTPARSVADRSRTLWDDWRHQYLPEIRRISAAWDALSIPQADRPALRAHLERTADWSVRLWEIHFLVIAPALHALEAFFDFCRRRIPGSTDLDAAVLLQGYPTILTEVDERLWNLAAAGPDARNRHEAVAEFLHAYGALGDEQGEFFSHSWADDPRPLETDIARRTADPDPRVRRRNLEAAREAHVAAARARLPEPDRNAFDEWHALAQIGQVLSEDHHFHIDRQWWWRIRRLCAACGTWLHRRGQLASPEDVPFLTLVELRAGISSGIDLRAVPPPRRAAFEQQRHLAPPPTLGIPAPERDHDRFWGPPVEQGSDDAIRGLPASPGVAQGRAVVMTSLGDTGSLTRGDVLVCGTTNASLVSVFDVISALVTDTGGILSHAAVVAREFGLPAVVGTHVATRRIRSGQRVEVNGTTGEVRVL